MEASATLRPKSYQNPCQNPFYPSDWRRTSLAFSLTDIEPPPSPPRPHAPHLPNRSASQAANGSPGRADGAFAHLLLKPKPLAQRDG